MSKILLRIIQVIALLGGLNFILIGIARFDIAGYFFGIMTTPTYIAYVVFGVCILISCFISFKKK
ncbi:MAG: DUF378 domain-containing protein [Pseudomonadota bacterium]